MYFSAPTHKIFMSIVCSRQDYLYAFYIVFIYEVNSSAYLKKKKKKDWSCSVLFGQTFKGSVVQSIPFFGNNIH